MKKFVVSIIFAVCTAVGFSQIAEKMFNPPDKVVVTKIEASPEGVRYEIGVNTDKNNSSFVRFITDTKGSLIEIHVVLGDHWAACMVKNTSGGWSHNYDQAIQPQHAVQLHTGVWVKFFNEKVAPTPVTVEDRAVSKTFVLEDSVNSPWEFVGMSENKEGNMLVLRKVGQMTLRSIPESEFLTVPQMNKPFALGRLGKFYCPLDTIEVDGKKMLVLNTQIPSAKTVAMAP